MTSKQEDVNYDDVQMEMSDDDDSDSSEHAKPKVGSKKEKSEESEMFSNAVDYRAYKNQFEPSGKSKKIVERTKSSEYGRAEKVEDTSEYGGGGEIQPEARLSSEKLKRLRQLSNEDFSAVVKESEEDRNLPQSDLKRAKKNFHEKERREKSSEHHSNNSSSDDRRHSRAEKSRSGSRDRKRSKKDRRDERSHRHRSRSRSRDRHQRRNRSRSSSRERHQHRQYNRDDHPRCDKRQELRNRKLVALGLTQAVSSDRHLPTVSGMAAAMANNYSSPDQVEAQLAHVKAVTGVDLPKYYNPTAINPLKFAEQIKKRQMLWGAKKPESNEPTAPEATNLPPVSQMQQSSSSFQQSQQQGGSFNKWESTNFGNSQANEKFRRLMGIKGGSQPPPPDAPAPANTNDTRKMFAEQEMEYERARAITHTQRGLGLGFASAPPAFKSDPNVSAPKPSTAGISFVKK